MKKLLLTLTATMACVAAFAQGKVTFQGDSLHLVYFTTDSSKLEAADSALAGQATPIGGATGGGVLAADLWAGTASTTLSKVDQTTMSSAALSPGLIALHNLTLPTGLAGGVPIYFQVQVYSASAGSYAAASAGQDLYYGQSYVFTTIPGSSIAFNSITKTTAPGSSTWLPGTYDLGNSSWGTGALGSIAIQANTVPEPTSLALFGLGAAAMMIFRRRK